MHACVGLALAMALLFFCEVTKCSPCVMAVLGAWLCLAALGWLGGAKQQSRAGSVAIRGDLIDTRLFFFSKSVMAVLLERTELSSVHVRLAHGTVPLWSRCRFPLARSRPSHTKRLTH